MTTQERLNLLLSEGRAIDGLIRSYIADVEAATDRLPEEPSDAGELLLDALNVECARWPWFEAVAGHPPAG